MSRLDFISLAGLRPDGRRAKEIRRIRCRLGVLREADGSAYLEMGQTKVIAIVKGPHEVSRRSDMLIDKAIVNCEFNLAPFAGSDRRKRRPTDRKTVEMAMSIKAVFEGAVMLELYPRTQIDLYIHLIQTDGGQLPASINAASLALTDAGISMRDMVVSCSAGHVDGQAVMDLNHMEQSHGGAYVPLAILPRGSEILLAKMEARLPLDIFQEVLATALEACRQVHAIMRGEVREHHAALLAAQLAL
ncbi:ribosomal protein S5 domain 2-type protein [Tribonema minus]|uniref:Ribosomal protein S5 domain 2-type protein n=1 Tax=Tribonema minus TaxID=303371 RepID=A0A835YHF5_9STRA|nr:ribosomal protein S5 domain 2-type protein [Tribonema minus]